MKFYIISILLLNITLCDSLGNNESDVAQGLMGHGHAMGQANNGHGHAMGQFNGQAQVFTSANGVQNVVGPTRVQTQRVNIAPRYVTERVTAKPRIITENVVQPVYQKTINRPSILRERVIQVPQFNRGQTQVVNNKPVVQAVQNRVSTRTRNVVVPGNQIHIQPVVQPRLLVRNDVVRVQQSEPRVVRHPATVRPVQTRQTVTNRVVNVPGNKVITRNVVQPIIQREKVNVQVQRGPTRRVNHRPIVQQAVVRNRIRNQRVVVPGNVVVTQPIVQPVIRNQSTQVRFVQGAPQQRNNQPIVRPTVTTNNTRNVYRNVVHTVPVERVVAVKAPYIQRVRHVREIYVPVDENGVEIGPDYKLNAGGSNANIVNNTNVHVHHGEDEDNTRFGCGGRYNSCCQGSNCNRNRQTRNKRERLAELYL